jgi:phage terminase large subunit GpA-like protein
MIEHHPGAPYASAANVISGALALLKPPTRQTVDEYALAHRLLPARSGIGTMRWEHDDAPYLVAPMRCSRSYVHTTVAVVGPGQCGKTAIAENVILDAVGQNPRNALWYMQTDQGIESYVKSRLNPMIEAHAEMQSRIGHRPEDNAQHFKKFAGMWLQLYSATYSNLISKSAPLIIADEWDAYVESLGDPKAMLDVRRQYYGRLSMLIGLSHPDRALGLDPNRDWRDGIMRVYADSDRRIWYWPCPHCGAWSSPVPIAKRVMTLEWPKDGTLDEIEREAHLLCPVNGCVIEDRRRPEMNLAAFRSPHGGWIGQGQDIAEDGTVTGELVRSDTAGFWIVGAMSPFLLSGIGGLARAMAKAQKEFEVSGDDTTVKEVTVKQFGFPYAARGSVSSVDAETLAERALSEEQPLDMVPEGVRFLTAWFDVQIAHFEILVRGWGVGAESWVVAKWRVPADTATDRVAWEKLLLALRDRRYPLAGDATRGMGIRAIGYDSGGAAGVSDRAYEVWRKLKKDRKARLFGQIDGRDVWNILPTKGSGNPNAPRLSVVYPDTQKKDKRTPYSGTVPLCLFNANQFKDDLAGQLKHAEPVAGYVHFPKALRSADPPHVVFEQVVSEKRDANGRWEKPHQGVRNEMLDLMVGTHVLAMLHGLNRLNWESPRAWHDVWEKNSMIESIIPLPPGSPAPAAKPKKNITDLLGPR